MTSVRNGRNLLLLVVLLVAGPALAGSPRTVTQGGTDEPAADGRAPAVEARFGRIQGDDVRLRNVPDANGRVLATVEPNSIVRVHGERSGWVKAEVPNGFPAWVHRKYVKETSEADVAEIARNGVNVRALPSDGVNNFPVGQLYAGDRVRTLPTPPELVQEALDWVHVWSPPGFWAWVRADQVADLGPSEKGDMLWGEALGALPVGRASAPKEASSTVVKGSPSRTQAIGQALERAHSVFERETQAGAPNYDLVRVAYDAVLELGADATVKSLVEERLLRIGLLESSAKLRAELESERDGELERREEESERIRKSIDEEARRKDPFRARFDERGLLERRTVGDATRYFLRWGGKDVCEVLCTNGRYDLDVFLGLDLGLRGEILPLPSGREQDVVPILDVARIEILARV